MKPWLLIVFYCFLLPNLIAQQSTTIFKDRKIINSFSTETLSKHVLDFRVAHRFGDLAGENGGWESFYGLESAQDILIGFDYGLTDNLLIGINRTKGSGPLRMLVNTYFKYKIAGQNSVLANPVAVSFIAMNTISTMPKSEEASAINNFPKFLHRMIHHFEMIVAKKFSPRISLQFNVGFTHRNFVNLDDINSILSLGGAGRFQISRAFAILLDASIPMRFQDVEFDHTIPIGIGFEWETGGGHVFQLNFTNAGGLSETDYLSHTQSRWSDGQFRFGFTIARQFKI